MNGYISEVKLLNVNLPEEACPILAYKFESDFGLENPNLLHYFKLNEELSTVNGGMRYIIMNRGNNIGTFSFTAANNTSYPRIYNTTSPGENLPQICSFREIKDCKGFYDWSILRIVPDPVYLGFSRKDVQYFDYFNFRNGVSKYSPSLTWNWLPNDKIAIYEGRCAQGRDKGTKIFEAGAKDPKYLDGTLNWGALPDHGFFELCGFKAKEKAWVTLDHIRITQSTIFQSINTAFYYTPGNKMVMNISESRYSNLKDKVVLARNCFEILGLDSDEGYITSTKVGSKEFNIVHEFDMANRFVFKSNGKCNFCVIPAYSTNPKKPMAGYSKSTYAVVQNLDLFPELTLSPQPFQGDAYSQSSIFSLNLGANFKNFFNYDYLSFIDCSSKTDPNLADFNCESNEEGRVNFLTSEM